MKLLPFNPTLKRQQGFTLIELLVALGVSAVIVVLAYQSISNLVNVKEVVAEHSQESQQLQKVIWTLQQDLTQMVGRSVQDELGQAIPALQYREDIGLELTRIAQYPTPNATGGLLRVAYQVDNGILYRLSWPVLDRAQDSEAKRVKLLTKVNEFNIRLLDSNNSWRTSWPQQAQALRELPVATEVSFTSAEHGEVKRLFMGVN